MFGANQTTMLPGFKVFARGKNSQAMTLSSSFALFGVKNCYW